jgi:hypothetical protein
MLRNSITGTGKRFRLGLEALEDRATPAGLTGPTLVWIDLGLLSGAQQPNGSTAANQGTATSNASSQTGGVDPGAAAPNNPSGQTAGLLSKLTPREVLGWSGSELERWKPVALDFLGGAMADVVTASSTILPPVTIGSTLVSSGNPLLPAISALTVRASGAALDPVAPAHGQPDPTSSGAVAGLFGRTSDLDIGPVRTLFRFGEAPDTAVLPSLGTVLLGASQPNQAALEDRPAPTPQQLMTGVDDALAQLKHRLDGGGPRVAEQTPPQADSSSLDGADPRARNGAPESSRLADSASPQVSQTESATTQAEKTTGSAVVRNNTPGVLRLVYSPDLEAAQPEPLVVRAANTVPTPADKTSSSLGSPVQPPPGPWLRALLAPVAVLSGAALVVVRHVFRRPHLGNEPPKPKNRCPR